MPTFTFPEETSTTKWEHSCACRRRCGRGGRLPHWTPPLQASWSGEAAELACGSPLADCPSRGGGGGGGGRKGYGGRPIAASWLPAVAGSATAHVSATWAAGQYTQRGGALPTLTAAAVVTAVVSVPASAAQLKDGGGGGVDVYGLEKRVAASRFRRV